MQDEDLMHDGNNGSGGGADRGGDRPTDADIVQRVRHGDVQAYGTLVERYERVLLAAVLPVLRDVHAAQDVVQDVFVHCYRKLPSLRDASRVGGWLLKAAGRAAVHAARRGRCPGMRMQSSEWSDDDAPAAPMHAGLLDDDERRLLLDAVRGLPDHERVAVSLRYFEGLGVHEVARVTGRPVGTVTKQLTRAIERLRGELNAKTFKNNSLKERTSC
jgi:RNA polymerase sigma-70 factor (ECF subfamily)